MKRFLRFIKKRRAYVIIIGIVLVVMGIWQWRQSRSGSDIETIKVTREAITETVSSSGKIKTLEQVDLHFQTGGRLAWVGVKEGDTVFAGQAIASLDSRELQKNLEKALRDYSKVRNDFEEDRLVTYDNPVITDTVKRILEKNQWDLEKAVLDVELRDIARNLATIVSPIAGIVTHLDTPIAGVNTSVTDTFTIANIDKLVFLASVDETEVGRITVGMPAEINLDAYPDQIFTGTVGKIAYAAEQTSAGATIFPVEIYFTDPAVLRIGLNGDVTINVRESSNTLTIPLEAIREEKDTKFVYVKEGINYRKQPVKTGLQTEDNVEITEGLAENAEVVISGL